MTQALPTSEAERQADQIMMGFYYGNYDYESYLEEHLYSLHKLRDRELFYDLEFELICDRQWSIPPKDLIRLAEMQTFDGVKHD